ncbi:thioredoxin family protein [Helicovermis profundi]|uniref:Thioredoxin domain-containing protein n=1 Tax=Helicovermis profundi TaxID=3065157 RepID=A0AAU9E4N1_9FIRM|nr:hypothetical protein HLPR_19070 [Clostridia bacterium S502]
MKQLENINEIEDLIKNETIVLGYFTSKDCNMCKDLYPKIEKMIGKFKEIKSFRAETDTLPSLVSKYNFYVIPTVILFIEGKETIKKSRTISILELENQIERYYNMIY